MSEEKFSAIQEKKPGKNRIIIIEIILVFIRGINERIE